MATSRGGVTHARIALRPAELGSIDVHIRSTAEGLVARVVAHTAQTVETLQHAANDLRQSLEEHGLNLMSLDIGQPGEREAGRAGAHAGGHAAGADESVLTDDEDTTTETLRLPSGVLVDVLA
jgi:flagellar hook-length control protein FliK